jgi:hypothetical protein
MVQQGVWTFHVACQLTEKFGAQGFDVLVAHGKARSIQPEVGEIVCWYGSKLARSTRLSFPDIAVISRRTDRTVLLAEIEERHARPKQVLADALATIIGDHISFRRGRSSRDLKIGPWTSLLVLVPERRKDDRLYFIERKLNEIRRDLQSPNANIGGIFIDVFSNENELERRLSQEIQRAAEAAIA